METINKINSISKNGFYIYPNSFREYKDLLFFITKIEKEKYLGLCGKKEDIPVIGFTEFAGKELFLDKGKIKIIFCKRNDENLKTLKIFFPSLLPSPLGPATSFGFGDRLGIANAAHIRSLNNHEGIMPVLAQQSIRELDKTGRCFTDVINDSIWNIFQEGYEKKWGADADHVKEKKHFAIAAEEGMTMFTLDTSDVLEERVFDMPISEVKQSFDINSVYLKNVKNKYVGKSHSIGKCNLKFDEDKMFRIALVYKKALDYIEEIFRFLKDKKTTFDFEISFDETKIETLPEAHYFIVQEMRNREIEFSSLALRFPGTFEKGVDYQGNFSDFEESIRIHGEIARGIGGYRLSLHSGSDKFSIYPLFNKYTNGFFHIKTSGTSWLEALRVIAACKADFFKEIYKIAADSFEENKKEYHMNLSYNAIPKSINNINDENLESIINNIDTRRVLHIAYGAILNRRKEDIFNVLLNNEEKHYKFLIDNIEKHIRALNY